MICRTLLFSKWELIIPPYHCLETHIYHTLTFILKTTESVSKLSIPFPCSVYSWAHVTVLIIEAL